MLLSTPYTTINRCETFCSTFFRVKPYMQPTTVASEVNEFLVSFMTMCNLIGPNLPYTMGMDIFTAGADPGFSKGDPSI